jgi:hypothetical protein
MMVQRLEALIDEVRARHASDPRLAVFEIEIDARDGRLVLHGATSEPAAVEALRRAVATLDGGVQIVDRIVRLPDVEPELTHALVTSAAAPMLAQPFIVGAQISQLILGHWLTVLRREGRWLHCRSDDGYLGWVHLGYVKRCDENAARAWAIGTGGTACVSLGAEVLAEDGSVLARLPWDARVVRQLDGSIRLPDGRVGQLRGELIPLSAQPLRLPAEGAAIIESAAAWLGAPYLWGGVTHGGVDCSGLAQTVFRLHGIELPRDSDMQARMGDPVDPGPRWENLRAGDLLFFAEDDRRVTHVVISEGGSKIIHSSLGNGGVKRNDLAGDLGYERELARIFVGARRVI